MKKVYKVTTQSGAVFHKNKIVDHRGRRRVYYTLHTMPPKDMHRLTLRQQDALKGSSLFPLRRKEFREILKRLQTTIKYKTRIE